MELIFDSNLQRGNEGSGVGKNHGETMDLLNLQLQYLNA